jgi:biopolymer transport protein ExbD
MADVQTGGDDHGGGKSKGKKRAKKASTHIDMTPMVDLAFLLLTFFVLTSTFSKPSAMEITMPVDDKTTKPTKVKNIVTILLTKSEKEAYCYFGELDTASTNPFQKFKLSAEGMRAYLFDKNKDAIATIKKLKTEILGNKSLDINKAQEMFKDTANAIMGKKEALTVVIKTTDDTKYGTVVNMVDEMSIVNVGKYALVDISETEQKFLDTYLGKTE